MNAIFVIPALIGVVSTIATITAIRLILLSRSVLNISAAVLLITMVLSLMGYLYQLVIPELSIVLFWQKVQILGINFMYPAWLIFLLLLTGNQKHICWRLIVLLFALSLFPNVVLSIPDISYWFVSTNGLISAGPFHVLDQDNGWVVWFSTGVATIQGIVGTLFLLSQRRKLDSSFKSHFYLLLILPIFPFLSIWVEIAKLNPIAPLSIFNLSIIPVSVAVSFTIYSLRVGDEFSKLKEKAVDSMHAAVIILDSNDRIKYANQVALKLLNRQINRIQNLPIAQASREIYDYLSRDLAHKTELNLISLGDFAFDVKVQDTLDWRGETTTKMIVLTNITEIDQLEKTILNQNREITHTNALLSGLTDVNFFLQSTNNLNDMFGELDKVLSGIGLSYFLTTIDPTSNELTINYLSSRDNADEGIADLLGSQVTGYHIPKNLFPQLYNFVNASTTEQAFPVGKLLESKNLHRVVKESIRLLSIDPSISLLLLQLHSGDKLLGVLGVWGNILEERDISTIKIFASQLASAIERGRIYQKELDRSKELTKSNQLITALVRVTTLMGSSGDYTESLRTLGSEIEQLNLHCVLGIVDEQSETLTFEFSSFTPKVLGLISRLTKSKFVGTKLPKKYWPGTRVIDEGLTVWYSNPLGIFQKMFPNIPESAFAKIMNMIGITADQNLCILPLLNRGEVVGVFPVWGEGISENDTSTLTVFAFQVGQILEQMKAYDDEQKRSLKLKRSNSILIALSKVASRLETTTKLSEIYQSLGDELKNVGIECMVGTIDEKKEAMFIEYLSISPLILEFTSAKNVIWPEIIRIPRSLWPTDSVLGTKEPYWEVDPIDNISKMFPFIPKKVMEKGFKAFGMPDSFQMCYLPIIVNDDVVGILAVWGAALHVDDVPGLMVFANQVSTSIHNSSLYDQAQKEIIIRKEAENKIQGALTEKEVLLKEVHHRVKNNLQIISSLLNLQMGQSSDPLLLEGLRESQTRVRAMALIHEKLYQSDDLSKIDMASYISSLTSALITTYRMGLEKVEIKVDSANIYLDLESAIPCGLIINELISNSLKYAFPDDKTGTIHVSLVEPGYGEYRLLVEDNGVGLPKGFAIENGSSLGLKLVSGLVKQLEGKMKVSNEVGVNFEIRFSRDISH